MLSWRRIVTLCGVLALSASSLAAAELESIMSRSGLAVDEEARDRVWGESEFQLPESSLPKALMSFYVSAATSNRFFVDAASLSVGEDGVVRYLLLVETPEGGRNVTFEGMRCETRERRIYASGRIDGSWSRSRGKQWFRIQDAASNRHHAALYLGYFCPDGVIARNADEIRSALKRDVGFGR